MNNIDNIERLIFPNPNEKICLVTGEESDSDILCGKRMRDDDLLGKKILEELHFPFHEQMIKLCQCSRNLVGDKKGPNVLYLSQTEGGFPRTGLILKEGGNEIRYPDLNYVDLVVNEESLAQGTMDIYSHELGHVMMMNIWKDFPEGISPKQHVSMGVTDYFMAFFEGWGVHFQRLVYENVPLYRDIYDGIFNYANISLVWHSLVDKELRLNAVPSNGYIYQKLMPDIDTLKLSPEDLILLEHTSPVFDKFRLKNAQQMLSCEGSIATLFYRINTNKTLQNNYLEKDFYERFLLSPIPDGVEIQDIFNPFENVFLKSFLVWSKIKDSITDESIVFIDFIREWCNSFPDDREEMFKLFIMTTKGKTVNSELGKVYEHMAYYGTVGNIQKLKELLSEYSNTVNDLVTSAIKDEKMLFANIGPQIWVENKDFLIRTCLWDPDNKKPLKINLNTASEFEIAALPNMDLEKAEEIIRKRDLAGYFKSLEDYV